MRTTATSPEYLTVPEIIARYRVSKAHVYRAIQEGKLEAVRIGERGPLRVPARALEAFVHPTGERSRVPSESFEADVSPSFGDRPRSGPGEWGDPRIDRVIKQREGWYSDED